MHYVTSLVPTYSDLNIPSFMTCTIISLSGELLLFSSSLLWQSDHYYILHSLYILHQRKTGIVNVRELLAIFLVKCTINVISNYYQTFSTIIWLDITHKYSFRQIRNFNICIPSSVTDSNLKICKLLVQKCLKYKDAICNSCKVRHDV
jgi:hypothetical protein